MTERQKKKKQTIEEKKKDKYTDANKERKTGRKKQT